MRICVTGTRGKSSVVRMLAAILREDGRRVLAKTTGTKAAFILPEGDEIEVRRRGLTSIIEQKELVKKAASLDAEGFIAEMMSIQPENHFIESQKILKPNMIVLTNVRCDHTDFMGKTKEEIAAVFASSITKKSTLFIPEKEKTSFLSNCVKNAAGKLICVKEKLPADVASQIGKRNFPANISLVYALGTHLNIGSRTIIKGLKKVKYDAGEFKVWQYKSKETQKTLFFANGFAANDPESTSNLISILNKAFPFSTGKLTGILNLRADRADRTRQWIEALKNGGSDSFKCIYVTGSHTGVVRRKLKNTIILRHKEPEKIMAAIKKNDPDDSAVVFGFGNIKGTGNQLINYWNKIGEEYGL